MSEPGETLAACQQEVQDGRGGSLVCGMETNTTCHKCSRPVCASCSEDSWLAECSETCPDCWAEVVSDEP